MELIYLKSVAELFHGNNICVTFVQEGKEDKLTECGFFSSSFIHRIRMDIIWAAVLCVCVCIA